MNSNFRTKSAAAAAAVAGGTHLSEDSHAEVWPRGGRVHAGALDPHLKVAPCGPAEFEMQEWQAVDTVTCYGMPCSA